MNNPKDPTFDPSNRQGTTTSETSNSGIFDLTGRIGRVQYFWIVLATTVLSLPIPYLGPLYQAAKFGFLFVAIPLCFALIFVGVAAAIKRCHDLGKSGWLVLLSLVPLVNLVLGLYLLFAKGMTETNRYGPPHNTGTDGTNGQPSKSQSLPNPISPTPREATSATSSVHPPIHGSLTEQSASDGFDEKAAYLQISEELESKTMDKGLWLKAMVQSSGGDERQQTIAFANLRMRQLRDAYAGLSSVATTASEPLSSQEKGANAAREELWAQASAELEGGVERTGLWAKSFAEARGQESAAKALYLRYRVGELQQEEAALAEQEVRKAEAAEHEAKVVHLSAVRRKYAESPKGVCPSCHAAILPLDAGCCSKCDADFGVNAAWHPIPTDEKEQVEVLKRAFHSKSKQDLTIDEVILLAHASAKDSSLVNLCRANGDTLLHLCDRFGLSSEAALLIANGATPVIKNGNGQ